MTCVTKMLHLPAPDSPSAVPVAQQKAYAEATPPSIISLTPTLAITQPSASLFSPSPAKISSSVFQKVFDGPQPLDTSAQSQEIELSSLNTPERARRSLMLSQEVSVLNSPIQLTVPVPLSNPDFSSVSIVAEGTGDARYYRGGDRSRDVSSTPEPSSCSGTECNEEVLTASGGMFPYSDVSNDGTSESEWERNAGGGGMLDVSGDKETLAAVAATFSATDLDGELVDGVCPLGVEFNEEAGLLDNAVTELARTHNTIREEATVHLGRSNNTEHADSNEVRRRKPIFSPTLSEESVNHQEVDENEYPKSMTLCDSDSDEDVGVYGDENEIVMNGTSQNSDIIEPSNSSYSHSSSTLSTQNSATPTNFMNGIVKEKLTVLTQFDSPNECSVSTKHAQNVDAAQGIEHAQNIATDSPETERTCHFKGNEYSSDPHFGIEVLSSEGQVTGENIPAESSDSKHVGVTPAESSDSKHVGVIPAESRQGHVNPLEEHVQTQ